MRRSAGLLLLLAGACGSGPYGPFDAGHDVHVIVLAKPTPIRGITVSPVVTLGGGEPVATPSRLLKAKEAPAVEVAILLAPAGKHRLTVREPRRNIGGSIDLEVEREVWVVMEMRHGEPEGRLRVYDRPPIDEIGRYVPLVPVPD
jgi:hypothetical protein